jgi:cadmium resistance protein CadD (predicted permease)
MRALISLAGLAVALFVSTDIDNLFALLGFFLDHKHHRLHVVLGQYVGIMFLFSVSAIAASLSRVIPVAYVAWLGLVPVAIGLKKIWDWRSGAGEQAVRPQDAPKARASGTVATVALVCIANGGDNIGTYTPQFAVHSGAEVAVMGMVFAVMTGIWCLIGQGLVDHPAFRAPLRIYGHRIVPLVLIALGLATLYEGGAVGRFFH